MLSPMVDPSTQITRARAADRRRRTAAGIAYSLRALIVQRRSLSVSEPPSRHKLAYGCRPGGLPGDRVRHDHLTPSHGVASLSASRHVLDFGRCRLAWRRRP